MGDDKIICLNVGGELMQTCKDTLVTRSSYFRNILTLYKYDNNEPLFVDDDPIIFKHILNNMRDHRYLVPFNLQYKLDWYGVNNIDLNIEPDPVISEKLNIQDIKLHSTNITNHAGLHALVATNMLDAHAKDSSYWYSNLTRKRPQKTVTNNIIRPLNKSDKFNGFTVKIPYESDAISNIMLYIKLPYTENKNYGFD